MRFAIASSSSDSTKNPVSFSTIASPAPPTFVAMTGSFAAIYSRIELENPSAELSLEEDQELAGDATMLFYLTDEAHEGSRAFLEKRKPDFSKFPRRP